MTEKKTGRPLEAGPGGLHHKPKHYVGGDLSVFFFVLSIQCRHNLLR